ncbi:MAG: ribosome-associated translation inhibitor RaiA [Planctomycetota bacterium]
MQINLTTRHGQLNEANQEKLRAKAEKLSRFFERLTAIDVVVDLEDSNSPKIDLSVSAEHKHDFKAHAQSSSLASAFDAALQKVEQQLRKYKEKVQTRGRNPDAKRHETPDEA